MKQFHQPLPDFFTTNTMTSALRRSRRAVPTKTSNYAVGDIVEIIRNSTVSQGKLAYNLTEGGPSSSNPLWLVKFDNQKEEELYEHYFGKVLKTQSNDDDKTMPPPSSRRNSSSSEGDRPKRVTFSPDTLPSASDDSSSSSMNGHHHKNESVSARKTRSRRRRHAKVDTPVVHSTRKRPRGAPLDDKRGADTKKMRNNEEVVVVKLLTGTLYLYKGVHRRAEFVRRV